jgi:hypothetical protein
VSWEEATIRLGLLGFAAVKTCKLTRLEEADRSHKRVRLTLWNHSPLPCFSLVCPLEIEGWRNEIVPFPLYQEKQCFQLVNELTAMSQILPALGDNTETWDPWLKVYMSHLRVLCLCLPCDPDTRGCGPQVKLSWTIGHPRFIFNHGTLNSNFLKHWVAHRKRFALLNDREGLKWKLKLSSVPICTVWDPVIVFGVPVFPICPVFLHSWYIFTKNLTYANSITWLLKYFICNIHGLHYT